MSKMNLQAFDLKERINPDLYHERKRPNKRNNIQKQTEVNAISKEKNKQYISSYLKRVKTGDRSAVRTE